MHSSIILSPTAHVKLISEKYFLFHQAITIWQKPENNQQILLHLLTHYYVDPELCIPDTACLSATEK